MVLKVVNEKSSQILYGRKMTETELKGQIKFIEDIADPLKEDFAVTLARIYDWNPVLEWEYTDFIYDSDNKTLVPSVPEEEQGEQEQQDKQDKQDEPPKKF